MLNSLDNAIQVAVTMRRVPNTGVASRWESHRWELARVQPLLGTVLAPQGESERVFAPFEVRLFKDDAEGYHTRLVLVN